MNNSDARIAVLEANYAAIDRRAVEHEKNDEERFSKIDTRFDKTDALIESAKNEILAKLNPLWDEKNQRTGALKLSSIAAHCVTGFVAVAMALGIKKLW